MKTDDLISALAADTLPQRPVWRQFGGAMIVALALAVVAFAVTLGPRADIWAALGSLAAFKTLMPAVLAGVAGAVALALAHPAARRAGRMGALAALIAVTVVIFGLTFARDGQAALVSALSTPQLWVCLVSIPALALPLLAGALWGLSTGASTQPRLAGAMAGLVAGALAAAVYSLYCDKDMVLFVVPAYATAIACVMLLGAILGPRPLKW
jgi:hypothetical protein